MNWGHYKLYFEALLWGIFLWLFACVYYFIQTPVFTLYTANRALTFSGGILILLSFALSGITYFFSIGKGKLGYRKALGVVGFSTIVLHMLISDVLFTNSFRNFSYFIEQPGAFVSSFTAVGIYTMMVIVSNFGMPAKIGAVRWRRLLRVGYVAIFLSIIHFSLLRTDQWIAWFFTFEPPLPPLSLILFILSVATLLLRLALEISLRKKSSQ